MAEVCALATSNGELCHYPALSGTMINLSQLSAHMLLFCSILIHVAEGICICMCIVYEGSFHCHE